MNRATQSPLTRYLAHLEKGELAYQVDVETDRAIFFPRVIAPGSGNAALEWRVSSGRGTVYATTVNRPRDKAPYNVALIDVEEGFRMMSSVRDIEPDAVKVGMRVKLKVELVEGAAPLPVFVPLESQP